MSSDENPLDDLTPEELQALKQLAQQRASDSVSRRDFGRAGLLTALGLGGAAGATGTAVAQESSNEEVGTIGSESGRVDVFADTLDANELIGVETGAEVDGQHIEPASVSTDNLFTAARAADVVVWTDDSGTVHASGADGEIDSDTTPEPVIKSAIQATTGHIYVTGDYTFNQGVYAENYDNEPSTGRKLTFAGTITAGADVKLFEFYRVDGWEIDILGMDMADTAKIGVDLVCSNNNTVRVKSDKLPGGTFDEDDGSGNGTQTYPRAGVRVKGIEDDRGAYYNEIVASHLKRATSGEGVGIDLRSSTPDSTQVPNHTIIRPRRVVGLNKGVNIESGASISIHSPELTGCTTGIHNQGGILHVFGSGFIEAATTAIQNDSKVVVHGNIQYAGSETEWADPSKRASGTPAAELPRDATDDHALGGWKLNDQEVPVRVTAEIWAGSSGDELALFVDQNDDSTTNTVYSESRTADNSTDRLATSFIVPSWGWYRIQDRGDGSLGRVTVQRLGANSL